MAITERADSGTLKGMYSILHSSRCAERVLKRVIEEGEEELAIMMSRRSRAKKANIVSVDRVSLRLKVR